jgi:hypothetical protein
LRQRRQSPGEAEGELEVIGRIITFGPADDRVLEAEQHPRVDVERKVEVDGPFASFLGVHVDLPCLSQRIALDKMSLVVDMEAVLDRVILEVGDEPGDVDDGHL